MKNIVKLLSAVMMLSVLAMPVIAQSDAPADHNADVSAGFDVVSMDTDSADLNTDVVEVYPAGSENSVFVSTPTN